MLVFIIFDISQEFFNVNPVASAVRRVEQSCEAIRLNAQWLGQDKEAIETWWNNEVTMVTDYTILLTICTCRNGLDSLHNYSKLHATVKLKHSNNAVSIHQVYNIVVDL